MFGGVSQSLGLAKSKLFFKKASFIIIIIIIIIILKAMIKGQKPKSFFQIDT